VKISAWPNKLLSPLGLKLVRAADAQKRLPIEMAPEDRRIFEYVRTHRLSSSSDERLFATLMACQYVAARRIPGDFVECGVWRGGNSILAADVFRRAGAAKAVWLYDTFAGMTPPSAADVNYAGEAAQAKFTASQKADHNEWCYAPFEEVEGHFARAGLMSGGVKFVKGDVAVTLADPLQLPQSICVLRLDTDWYESTRLELEVLFPRLTPGGVLILDDYGHWGGARQAVDEYFANRPRPFFQYIDATGRIAVKCD
jgi:O-methyltransferase